MLQRKKEVGEHLMFVQQEGRQAAKYALEFYTLVAESDWKKPTLKTYLALAWMLMSAWWGFTWYPNWLYYPVRQTVWLPTEKRSLHAESQSSDTCSLSCLPQSVCCLRFTVPDTVSVTEFGCMHECVLINSFILQMNHDFSSLYDVEEMHFLRTSINASSCASTEALLTYIGAIPQDTNHSSQKFYGKPDWNSQINA